MVHFLKQLVDSIYRPAYWYQLILHWAANCLPAGTVAFYYAQAGRLSTRICPAWCGKVLGDLLKLSELSLKRDNRETNNINIAFILFNYRSSAEVHLPADNKPVYSLKPEDGAAAEEDAEQNNRKKKKRGESAGYTLGDLQLANQTCIPGGERGKDRREREDVSSLQRKQQPPTHSMVIEMPQFHFKGPQCNGKPNGKIEE
ncbi:hypothetical protein EYF80_004540 [Liparis tanakae]|uniref:Uncharacterized protein n=1 Tax=Liparis tanakae TaxID=230148 RepID=A0A4Z2J4T6_9TELE|nr:hypothetical protein EYF80_004540 [Liparis tanakae]